MEQFEDINFKRIAEILSKNIALVVAFSLLVGVGAFVYSKVMVTPKYESSVTMYVKNGEETKIDKTLGSDIQTAQMLVDTYIVIIRSDTFLNEVANKLADMGIESYDAETLRRSINASAVDSTEIFSVKVKNKDPMHSYAIANVIAEVAPSVISHFIDASSVKVVDYAVKGKMVSPDVKRNMTLGLLIGALLGFLFAIFKEVFDLRVKNEDSLIEWFSLPVLGRIPDFETIKLNGRVSNYPDIHDKEENRNANLPG
jgi:capsular polysaccharide biosynthesis protein